MAVEIALLGEVNARVDGQPMDLGPARQRCVLAAYLRMSCATRSRTNRVSYGFGGPVMPDG